MGILNVTPDSFSDGGKFLKNYAANKQVRKLIKDGADIIDVGGESTRPGSKDINPKKEWKRIKPKLNYLSKQKCFISLDTRKSSIIKKSLFYKVWLKNDISWLDYDKESLNILKNYKIPFVLHHIQGTPNTMQKNPSYNNVLLDIYDYFEKKLKQIRANKIKHNNFFVNNGDATSDDIEKLINVVKEKVYSKKKIVIDSIKI